MDEIDKKILTFLQKDDKTSYSVIAESLKMAPSTVHFRIQKMLKNGIIESFSAIVNPYKAELGHMTCIGLTVKHDMIEQVAKKLSEYGEAQIVAATSGSKDMMVKVMMKDEKELWKFINEKIKPLKGVGKEMDVITMLDIYKNTHIIPL